MGRQKTANLVSVQNIILRNSGKKMKKADMVKLSFEEVNRLFSADCLRLSIWGNVQIIRTQLAQIAMIEKKAREHMKPGPEANKLIKVPGIRDILATTILQETGDTGRFAEVGNYNSIDW